ncbi:MAG: 16S rRNA (guanine(966)-N(2))-methyltransferase RsmD [Bacilli bacterium]|nr:16S rRNA (guanine(966)-N(2))-methyltransferase RsmD [Bacilli bacterium]
MIALSGKYKGRRIKGFDMDGTRPTMDRVKESLFGMIQEKIKDSIILDLFSGSGNLAIESLSEGARVAYAVDKNGIATKTIKENIKEIGIENLNVYKMDYEKALLYLKEEKISFDVIFLDPPYKTDYIKKSIEIIEEYNLLKEDGIMVCESDRLEKIEFSEKFMKIKEKKYGDKWVVIIKKV